ncbi:MAG TPA: TetR/AcrR family transcriptional regulator [Candidatus Brachybacterium merdigallinarum]|nr:TetR/AcrR family transcriptional regulator [Candidatus Brachybacterium merdigallinarum]
MIPFAPLMEQEEAEGPRGRYRKTEQTRARILDAALEVFGEHGYERGSLREVAQRAGISQAGLLHQYPNKVALLSAILERRDARAGELVGSETLDITSLLTIVEYARASSHAPFEIDLFAVLSAEATREDHPANDYMRRRYGWAASTFDEIFREVAAAGQLTPGTDPTELTSQFIALWDGLQIQWLLKVNDVDIADRLESFLNLHLVRPLRELAAEQEHLRPRAS